MMKHIKLKKKSKLNEYVSLKITIFFHEYLCFTVYVSDQYLTWNAKEIVLSVLAGADTRDRPMTYSRKSILPDPSCRQYKYKCI